MSPSKKKIATVRGGETGGITAGRTNGCTPLPDKNIATIDPLVCSVIKTAALELSLASVG